MSLIRRASHDRDRREEIDSYIRIETDENMARGMSESDARAAAIRKFGNSTRVREEIYAMNTLRLPDSLIRNLRYSVRAMRNNPAFTAAALLTLALGIGANTAVFSVIDGILLKPLNYPESDRLVAIAHTAPGAAGLASVGGDLRLSQSMYVTYAEHSRSFRALGIWAADTAAVTGLARPEEVRGVRVSGGSLEALAAPPAMGRLFSDADYRPGAPAVVILAYGYWQRRFGKEPRIVGRTVNIDSRPTTIAGVMPSGFRFPGEDADVILPLSIDRAKLTLPGFGFQCVARLRNGVTAREAAADLARLVPVWMNSWPAAPGINPHVYENWRIAPLVRPLRDDLVGSVGSVLWIVMGTIGIVMLIVCANIANLQLVRAEARSRELAVRAALGAGRARIVGELLTESLVLALAGGALGIALAWEGLRVLTAIGPGQLPRLNEIGLDARALGFTFVISVTAGILFGAVPAIRYARNGIAANLRAGGRGCSEARERHRVRDMLAIAQIALSLVLLIGAGLMIRTFQALHSVTPGFTDPGRIQILRTSVPRSLVREPERVIRILNDIADRFGAIPGVESAAFASEMPMEGNPVDWDIIRAEGRPMGGEIPPLRIFRRVSPGVPRVLGARIAAGRDFTWPDIYGRRPGVMVSENLAREFWGSAEGAIGKRISTGLPSSPWREVIGVVEDVRDNGVARPAPAMVYWPAYGAGIYSAAGTAEVERDVTFAIRTSRAGTRALLDQIEQAVWAVNSSLPLSDVRTMRRVYDTALARPSFTLVMLAIASGIALLLGLIGVYGLISYAVSQRRREIGIRLALGARESEMKRMFVAYGAGVSAIGVLIGLAGSAALTQLMKSVLFGVNTLDPITFLAVPGLLAGAVVLASYLPARRAAGVDPAETLRAE